MEDKKTEDRKIEDRKRITEKKNQKKITKNGQGQKIKNQIQGGQKMEDEL